VDRALGMVGVEMKNRMKILKTNRKFKVSSFKDYNGQSCSIQESSLATDFAIWLGCDKGMHVDGQCCARMHLNQTQAKALIPLLNYFVKHGELPTK
jgi:hypothetical protein